MHMFNGAAIRGAPIRRMTRSAFVLSARVVQRHGAHYVPNQWDQSENQWHFLRAHWER
jgi:hypothetical protein